MTIRCLLLVLTSLVTGEAMADAVVDGELRVWHAVTVRFCGPAANETDDRPNPFLDYRLQVVFAGPSGQRYDVPGFFDGDGHGGAKGNVWCARFAPDEAGISVTQNRGRKTYSMGAQVYAKPGEIYAIYLPKAEDGAVLDLSGVEGRFQQRWYNPRTGQFEGPALDLAGSSRVPLGKPPRHTGKDWAVLIQRAP